MLGDNPLALQVIPGLGGTPLKLEVSVTPSDEVQALRSQVQALKQDLSDLQTRYNRTEYLYRCETLVNLQLMDLCKQHDISIPHRLFQRPDSFSQLPQGDARA